MSVNLGRGTVCAREDVKLIVGHQRRHLAGWLEAKRQVDQGIDLSLKTLANPLQLMVEFGELPIEWPGPYETRSRIVRGEGMAWQ